MTYTLIQPNGQVRTFFLLAVCEMYQKAYGGVVVSTKVLADQTAGELFDTVAEK